jgi:glutamate synthase (ferredoxin)
MIFADAVSYPFRIGFAHVYKRFAEAGLADDVVFEGGGKLGIPENAIVAFAMGVDMVNVGREAMLAIGCIQAQKCHTDHCPVGVATQNPRYTRGLDPTLKSVRAANYLKTLRRDLVKVSEAVGVSHPGLIGPEDVDVMNGVREGESLRDLYGYADGWGLPGPAIRDEIDALMAHIVAAEADHEPPTPDDQKPVRASQGRLSPMP